MNFDFIDFVVLYIIRMTIEATYLK